MAKSGRCVLSFGDTVLYEADLKALENGRWLSDPVISFAFEYLHKKTLDETNKSKVCLHLRHSYSSNELYLAQVVETAT